MLENVDWPTIIISAIIGSAVLGYPVSIVGAFTHDLIKQRNAESRKKKRQEDATNKVLFETTVRKILDDPHEEIVMQLRYNNLRVGSLIWFLASLILLVSGFLLVAVSSEEGFIFESTTAMVMLMVALALLTQAARWRSKKRAREILDVLEEVSERKNRKYYGFKNSRSS